jgi:hypothetical protein
MMAVVRACLQRIFVAVLLAVCVGAPVLEMFDHWDRPLQDGSDTESNLVVVVLCVGIGFVAAATVIRCVRAPQASTCLEATSRVFVSSAYTPFVLPIPDASPPTVLRV